MDMKQIVARLAVDEEALKRFIDAPDETAVELGATDVQAALLRQVSQDLRQRLIKKPVLQFSSSRSQLGDLTNASHNNDYSDSHTNDYSDSHTNEHSKLLADLMDPTIAWPGDFGKTLADKGL